MKKTQEKNTKKTSRHPEKTGDHHQNRIDNRYNARGMIIISTFLIFSRSLFLFIFIFKSDKNNNHKKNSFDIPTTS